MKVGDGSTTWNSLDYLINDRYRSAIVSSDTALDADTHYFTGSGTTINSGITLTLPLDSLLEVKLYSTGKAI